MKKKNSRKNEWFACRNTDVSISLTNRDTAIVAVDGYHSASEKRVNSTVIIRMTIDQLISLRDQINHVLDLKVKVLNLMIEDRKVEDAYFAASNQIAEQTAEQTADE